MQDNYILGSNRIQLLETRMIIYYAQVDGKTKRNKTTPKYDLENIDTKYTVEVKNRFSILQVDGNNPEDLLIDIRDAVIETVDKWIPKVKKSKVTKWLTKETIKITEERREAKGKGEIEKYKQLNAEFQQQKSKV